MSKQIVFLFDGTGHSMQRGRVTHVTRTLTAVLGHSRIVPFYTSGVGTKNVKGVLAQVNETVFGSILGVGLDADLKEAYLNLCAAYDPGDLVYIFGWSRGAYLGRSLIGLVRNVGIMPKGLPRIEAERRADAAMRLYRGAGKKSTPWCESSLEFRANHSPDYTVHRDEVQWRALHGIPEGKPFRFQYAGFWDTVGVKGVNGLFTQVLANIPGFLRTPFHDNELSNVTLAARHAVAIDERSRILPSTLWDRNLKDMNGGNHGETRPYQQEWFPGCHRVVGGAVQGNGLSYATLHWMLAGAVRQGLQINPAYMDHLQDSIDPMAPLAPKVQSRFMRLRKLVFHRMLGRARANVTHYRDVNTVAQRRLLASQRSDERPYQPPALTSMWRTLWLWMTDGEETPPPINKP